MGQIHFTVSYIFAALSRFAHIGKNFGTRGTSGTLGTVGTRGTVNRSEVRQCGFFRAATFRKAKAVLSILLPT